MFYLILPLLSLFIILRFSFSIFWCFYFFDIFDWPSKRPALGLSLRFIPFGPGLKRARGFLINFPARKSFSTTFAFSWHLTAWRLFNSMSTVSPPPSTSTVLMPHFVACNGRERKKEISRFCVIPFIRVINFYCQPLSFICVSASLRRGVAQLVYNVCNIKLFQRKDFLWFFGWPPLAASLSHLFNIQSALFSSIILRFTTNTFCFNLAFKLSAWRNWGEMETKNTFYVCYAMVSFKFTLSFETLKKIYLSLSLCIFTQLCFV